MPVLARRWPALGLPVIAGVFAWAVSASVAGHEDVRPGMPLTLALVFAVVLGLVTAALWAVVPGVRAIGVLGAVCLVASAALLASAPVDFTYSDGCNDHTTAAPVVLVPVLAVARPNPAPGTYEDLSTLKACAMSGGLR